MLNTKCQNLYSQQGRGKQLFTHHFSASGSLAIYLSLHRNSRDINLFISACYNSLTLFRFFLVAQLLGCLSYICFHLQLTEWSSSFVSLLNLKSYMSRNASKPNSEKTAIIALCSKYCLKPLDILYFSLKNSDCSHVKDGI